MRAHALLITSLPTAALANGAMGAAGLAAVGVGIAYALFAAVIIVSVPLAVLFAWVARRERTRGWLIASAIMLSLSTAFCLMIGGAILWYGLLPTQPLVWAIPAVWVAGALAVAIGFHRQAVAAWRAQP